MRVIMSQFYLRDLIAGCEPGLKNKGDLKSERKEGPFFIILRIRVVVKMFACENSLKRYANKAHIYYLQRHFAVLFVIKITKNWRCAPICFSLTVREFVTKETFSLTI